MFDNDWISRVALTDSGKKLLTENGKTGLKIIDAATCAGVAILGAKTVFIMAA